MDNIDKGFLRVLGQLARSHFSLTHGELEKHGLYPGQPQLLFLLCKKDGISQRDLASKLHISPATINVMIKRLEKGGFLYKKADEKDGRMSRIFISPKGLNACADLRVVITRIDNICLENFSEDERNTLNNLLNKVKTNLDKHIE